MITTDTIQEFFDYSSNNETNQIFISEKDLVFCFGLFLHKKFPDATIKFEFPFTIAYSYNSKVVNVKDKDKCKSGYLDLYVILNEKTYGFEFKYKTKEMSVQNDLLSFKLKNQGAQDLLRFEFRKDIHRLEYLKQNTNKPKIDIGFAILLSNDNTLYNNEEKETADIELRFSDEIPIQGGSFNWHPKDKNASWLKEPKFTMDLKLRTEGYEIKWYKYIEYQNNLNSMNCTFKYCMVKV